MRSTTDARTLAEAMDGADVLLRPLGQGRASTQEMVKGMAQQPIVFAMANPDPEITPEDAQGGAPGRDHRDRPLATTRTRSTTSWAFRTSSAARSTCARRTINDAMKIAAAYALAALAREDVPDEVSAAYRGRRLRYGPDYMIPTPFDPRLIRAVPLGGRRGGDEQRRRAQADRRSASATATRCAPGSTRPRAACS